MRPAHAWTERRKKPREAAGLVGSPGVLPGQRLAEDARRGTAGCVGKVTRETGQGTGPRQGCAPAGKQERDELLSEGPRGGEKA